MGEHDPGAASGAQVLRRDAARDRERLLQAGREVFATCGLAATLNDAARHAGLGVGTAYRRFASKAEPIDAILVQQVTELESILREALAIPDVWQGLVAHLKRALAVQVADRGMAQLFAGRHAEACRHDWEPDRLTGLVEQIAGRARAAGVIRAAATGTDLIMIQIGLLGMVATLGNGPTITGRSDLDEVYRRYLWLAPDGLRPVKDARPHRPCPPRRLTNCAWYWLVGRLPATNTPKEPARTQGADDNDTRRELPDGQRQHHSEAGSGHLAHSR